MPDHTRRGRLACRTAVGIAAAIVILLTGCTSDPEEVSETAEPEEAAIPTRSLPPGPAVEQEPSGTLVADLRQSSRDAALGRLQVWVTNGSVRDVEPRRIVYRDPRLRTPVTSDRMRTIPAGSFRGFSVPLPEPECGRRDGPGRLGVTDARRTRTLPVADDYDLVAEYVASRCLELAVADVASLRWDEGVEVLGEGEGTTALLTLLVEPTGRGDGRLRIETVHGTPIISPVGEPFWRPRVTILSTDRTRRIELEARPTRCDAHAFLEAGGGTAFRVRLRLDGRAGELILRMSPEAAGNTIGWAVSSCGLR